MTLPLEGLVVLDLTRVLAGPYCAMQLRDLGALVIKIERPGSGDDTRSFPPFQGDASAYFAGLNAGKRSVALDLKAAGDRAIFEAILPRADVLLENFRPGVMDALGYGWQALHARHPRLIYGAVSGFGQTGPDAGKPAYDMVVQARGGIMSITGERGRGPVRVGASIGDITAGMFLTQGILAALIARGRTGMGQLVDVSMLDCQLAILEHAVALTTVTGTPPGRSGARHPTIAPFETYDTQDGVLVLAAGNDALFARLCAVLGIGLASDPRFATNAARVANVQLLRRLIESALLEHDTAHWEAALNAAGLPNARVQDVAQVLADPQIRARNMVVTTAPDSAGRSVTIAGNPLKLSDMPDPPTRPAAPALDQDRAWLQAWLTSGASGGDI